MVRLAKYIAQRGLCSRRKAEELIRNGEVTINDTLADITTPVNPEQDIVLIHRGC